MLLKVGVAAMIFSVALVAGVAVMVAVRDEPPEQAVTARPVAAEPSAVPEAEPSLPPMPTVEKPEPRPRPKPEPEPKEDPEPRPKPEPKPHPEPKPEPKPDSQPRSKPQSQPENPLPVTEEGWPGLKRGESELVSEPRRFELPPGAVMGLTVKSLGLYNVPVISSDSQWALDNGVIHVPETSLPWDGGAQRNVYIAGHRLGYPGTGSRLIFYNLDKLGSGDEILLKDRRGRTYRYRVSETFLADFSDSWVMGQVRGRDMVTLQTCTPIPTFEKRLIVRADRV